MIIRMLRPKTHSACLHTQWERMKNNTRSGTFLMCHQDLLSPSQLPATVYISQHTWKSWNKGVRSPLRFLKFIHQITRGMAVNGRYIPRTRRVRFILPECALDSIYFKNTRKRSRTEEIQFSFYHRSSPITAYDRQSMGIDTPIRAMYHRSTTIVPEQHLYIIENIPDSEDELFVDPNRTIAHVLDPTPSRNPMDNAGLGALSSVAQLKLKTLLQNRDIIRLALSRSITEEL